MVKRFVFDCRLWFEGGYLRVIAATAAAAVVVVVFISIQQPSLGAPWPGESPTIT
jgi:hypothetical protein